MDAENTTLEELLDIFASAFDLRDIAAAFCKAGPNFEAVAQILSESNPIMPCSNHNSLTSKPPKPRSDSVSTGTVSSVIGKGYSKPTPFSNPSPQTSKPIKINLTDFEMVCDDALKSDSQTTPDSINTTVQDFIFRMLGDGFQLGIDVIQDVLGSCGYDANKSIDKLIDLSAAKLNRSDDIVAGTAEQATGDDSMEHTVHSKRNGASVSREVLTSLFRGPDRHVEQPRKPFLVRAVKKTRTHGKVVSEPLIDTTPRLVTDSGNLEKDAKNDLEEEDSYQILRRNAKEHWVTMKEYYKDAVDAFLKGNLSHAEVFLQQGHFFNKKAREADEKSSQNIFECSVKEDPDDVILDLHDCDAKEAIRILKVHLINFSGIQNVRVILDAASEDITKGSRRRRQVLKLLEQASVKWTEEGGTITIQLVDTEVNEFCKNS